VKLINDQKGSGAFIVTAVVLSAIMTVLVYMLWYRSEDGLFERTPPEIELSVESQSIGLGLNLKRVDLTISDQGMGLDEVAVRLEQHRERVDIVKRKLEGEKKVPLTFEIGGPDSYGDEGEGSLEIKVWDKSFWSNSAEKIIPLKIDKTLPKVSILTSQHNGQEGGSQLAFYRAQDANLIRSGVRIASQYFVGSKGGIFDSALTSRDVYGVVYAMPANRKLSESNIDLFAEDIVGNQKLGNFYKKIANRKYRKFDFEIPERFLTENVRELTNKYKLEREESSVNSDVDHFRLLTDTVRKYEDQKIRNVINSRGLTKLMIDQAMMPIAGSPLYRYGEIISYSVNGDVVAKVESTGFRMDMSRGAPIYPAAEGEVIFADNLSYFGKTVVLDHGAGVSTVYAGLDNITVALADLVTPERSLGMAGSTGLFFKPGVLFEVRVQGEPVTPLEWWEGAWVKSHILDKIKETKRLLGVDNIIPIE
jgi:hypothetical protein